jgi:hypothetical protein
MEVSAFVELCLRLDQGVLLETLALLLDEFPLLLTHDLLRVTGCDLLLVLLMLVE